MSLHRIKPLPLLIYIYAALPLVIQLGRVSGFSPIITTASLTHTTLLTGLGATHVLDRNLSTPELQASIAQITTEPITLVYDAVSHSDTLEQGLEILAPGGQLADVSGTLFAPSAEALARAEALGKKKRLIVGMLRLPRNIELLETFFHDVLYDLWKDGQIKVSRCRSLTGRKVFNNLFFLGKCNRGAAEWFARNPRWSPAHGGR